MHNMQSNKVLPHLCLREMWVLTSCAIASMCAANDIGISLQSQRTMSVCLWYLCSTSMLSGSDAIVASRPCSLVGAVPPACNVSKCFPLK